MLSQKESQASGWTLGLVLILSVVVSATVWQFNPFGDESGMRPVGDARGYNVLAQNLVAHGTISRATEPPFIPSARRMPGYPLFIATIYQLVGTNVHAVKFVQILFGPVLCLLAFALGKIAFKDNRIAMVAAGLVAISPPLINYNNHLTTEGLFTVLLVGSTFATYAWLRQPSYGRAVSAGLLWGTLTLVKPEAALFPVAIVPVVLLLCADRHAMTRQCAVALVATGFLVGPWIYRNYVVFDKVCLVAKQGEHESDDGDVTGGMLRSYRKCAEHGVFFKPNRYKFYYANADAVQQRFEAAMEADVENPEESDVMYFVKRPNKFLFCCLGRFIGLCSPTSWSDTFGLSDGFSEYKADGRYVQLAMKAGLLASDVLLVVLGGIGFLLSLQAKHRHLWIISATVAYFLAVYVLVHGISRYRVPLTPLLLLLASWVVVGLLSQVVARFKMQELASAEAILSADDTRLKESATT